MAAEMMGDNLTIWITCKNLLIIENLLKIITVVCMDSANMLANFGQRLE
jgi:hypothetical protein